MHRPAAVRLAPLIWSLATLAVVGVVVGIGLYQLRDRDPAAGGVESAGLLGKAGGNPSQPPVPAMVADGHDYYVFVRLVEMNEKRGNGKTWDSVDDSAPDPYFILFWKGVQVFESSTRSDQLIAQWDLFRVDVKDIIATGGQIDIAQSLNAPLVRAEAGTGVRLEVWDDDPVGDDEGVKIELKFDDLKLGENVITPPQPAGVRRVIVQLIDRTTPLADLIEMAARK